MRKVRIGIIIFVSVFLSSCTAKSREDLVPDRLIEDGDLTREDAKYLTYRHFDFYRNLPTSAVVSWENKSYSDADKESKEYALAVQVFLSDKYGFNNKVDLSGSATIDKDNLSKLIIGEETEYYKFNGEYAFTQVNYKSFNSIFAIEDNNDYYSFNTSNLDLTVNYDNKSTTKKAYHYQRGQGYIKTFHIDENIEKELFGSKFFDIYSIDINFCY